MADDTSDRVPADTSGGEQIQCTKMADPALGVPSHVTIPDNIKFGKSTVDDSQTGVFCVCPIAKGTLFGPYEGKIIAPKKVNKTDPRFSWQVFDLETMKLLHVLDSSDVRICNWLRYVCCARYLEEQNIVSRQEGEEIFYRAMKDIAPGEELLTWFQPKKNRRRSLDRPTITDTSAHIKHENGVEIKRQTHVQAPTRDLVLLLDEPERVKRKRKPKIIPDAYEGPLLFRSSKTQKDHLFEPLLPGQKRRRRKKLPSDASDITNDSETNMAKSPDEPENGNNDIEHKPDVKVKKEIIGKSEQLSLNEINSSLPDWQFPQPGTEYVFELEPQHITTQAGRKVYKCDICDGLYKHMFSLKRHYLRNHINYKYLSKADLTNCLINLPQVIQLERNSKSINDTATVAGTYIKQEPNDNYFSSDNNRTVETSLEMSKTIKQEIIDNEYDKAADLRSIDNTKLSNKISDASKTRDRKTDTDSDENNEVGNGKLVIDINKSVSKDALSVNGELHHNSSSTNTDKSIKKTQQTPVKCSKTETIIVHVVTPNSLSSVVEARITGPMAKPLRHLYRCYTCYEYFNCKEDIRAHTENHPQATSGTMTFTCDKCSMRFPYKQNLVRHQGVHDVEVRKKPSKVKIKKEASVNSAKDVKTSTEIPGSRMKVMDRRKKQFKCEKCQMKFRHSQNLIKHMVIHKSDISGSLFPCDFCGKDFPSLSNLKKHVRFHLEYQISCRYCSDVFTNVGALRKHIRLNHPDIYKAKQQDKLARDGVLRRPDKKNIPPEDEVSKSRAKSPRINSADKPKTSDVENTGRNKKKSGKSNDTKAEKTDDEFLFDNADFAAEEIDDGGSRFKYSCTICKKRFSSYINMCRHRRKAHESKPKVEETPVTVEVKKAPSPVCESPETTALFYANVSNNIATNLNNYIDGKPESLEKFADNINIEGYTACDNSKEDSNQQVDFTWEWYNFPADYKPAKTISFSDIRNRFNIHSDFNHCEAAKTETSDTERVIEETYVESVKTNELLGDQTVEVKTVDDSKVDTAENEPELKVTDNSAETDSTNIMKLDSAMSMETLVDPAIKSALAFSHLRKKLASFQQDNNASPATNRFKRVIDGDYVNFDDLCDMLPNDIDSPMIKRKGSKCEPLSAERPLDRNTNEVVTDNHTDSKKKRRQTPMPLSLMCEQMLGLKRMEPHYWEIEQQSSKSVENLATSVENNEMLLSTLSLSSSPMYKKRNLILENKRTVNTFHPSDNFSKTIQNYENIAFGKNGQITSVCAICRKNYPDIDSLIRHHWKKHSASVCNFIEIEQGNQIENLYFSEPSPVGALAVTDPGLDDRDSYYCTRCNMPFETVSRLHVHIVSCSAVDPVSGGEKLDHKAKSPSKTPIKKKIKKSIQNIFNGGQNLKFKLKDFAGYKNGMPEENKPPKQLFSGRKAATPVRLIQKRNHDILCYNPSNHVRRRELTEISDSYDQCEACGLKFKSIILLERHVKNCSKKERFKDIQPMKCPIMEESLDRLKHICFYCDKNFTYMKSLVNHFQDFCPVKKFKVNKGQITEQERQKEHDIIEKLLNQEDEKVKEEPFVFSNGKRKGWQKGVKRKPKRKGFSWTSIKKKKPSFTENEVPECDTLETAEGETKSDGEMGTEMVNNESADACDIAETEVDSQTNESGMLHDIDEVDSGTDVLVVGTIKSFATSTNELKETSLPNVYHSSIENETGTNVSTMETQDILFDNRQPDSASSLRIIDSESGNTETVVCLKTENTSESGTEKTASQKCQKSNRMKKHKSKPKGLALFQCISAMKEHDDASIVENGSESDIEMNSPSANRKYEDTNYVSKLEVKSVCLTETSLKETGETVCWKSKDSVTRAKEPESKKKESCANKVEMDTSNDHIENTKSLEETSKSCDEKLAPVITLATVGLHVAEDINISTNLGEAPLNTGTELTDSYDDITEVESLITEKCDVKEFISSNTDNLKPNKEPGDATVTVNTGSKNATVVTTEITNGGVDEKMECKAANIDSRYDSDFYDMPAVIQNKENGILTCVSPVEDGIGEGKDLIFDASQVIVSSSKNSTDINCREERRVVFKKCGRPPTSARKNEAKHCDFSSLIEQIERVKNIDILKKVNPLSDPNKCCNLCVSEAGIPVDTKVVNEFLQPSEENADQIENGPLKVFDDQVEVTCSDSLNTTDKDNCNEITCTSEENDLTSMESGEKQLKNGNDIYSSEDQRNNDNSENTIMQTPRDCLFDQTINVDDSSVQNRHQEQNSQPNSQKHENVDVRNNVPKKEPLSENKVTVNMELVENMCETIEVNAHISVSDKMLKIQSDKIPVSKQTTKVIDKVYENRILQKSPEPVCDEDQFEYPLSPGEYVKVNKRHCKQNLSYAYSRKIKASVSAEKTLSSGAKVSVVTGRKSETKTEEDSAIKMEYQDEITPTSEISSHSENDDTINVRIKTQSEKTCSANAGAPVHGATQAADSPVRRGRKRKSFCLDELKEPVISQSSNHAADLAALVSGVKQKRRSTSGDGRSHTDKLISPVTGVNKVAKVGTSGTKKVDKLCKFFSSLKQPDQDHNELFSKQTRRSKERLRQILDV